MHAGNLLAAGQCLCHTSTWLVQQVFLQAQAQQWQQTTALEEKQLLT
jgi:hypothetical protein